MPTYSFEEIIEQLRWAESPEHVVLLCEHINEEIEQYCQFHGRLIVEAIRQKRLFFQQIKQG